LVAVVVDVEGLEDAVEAVEEVEAVLSSDGGNVASEVG
jgi:hypothetical protein